MGLELAAELYATITRVIPVPCPTISEVLRLLERTDRFAPTYAALKSKFELLCNRNDGSHTMNLTDFLNRSRAAAELGVPIDPFYFAWKHNELGINVTKAN